MGLYQDPVTTPNRQEHFEQLFREYYPGLHRYASVILKAGDVAEEVVNDVFLKYWMLGDNLQIRTSVKAFLITATRNHAIDRMRQMARQRGRKHELTGDFRADYASPHELVVGEETQRMIEAAIDALPPQGRTIFRMSRDAQMTYNEIAKSLSLSIKTVEAHMTCSLKSLRTVLREQLDLN